MVLHPFDQLGFAIAEADHASEIGGGWVSIVIVGDLKVRKLGSRGPEVGAGCLDLFIVAQWRRIPIFLVPILLPRQQVIFHFIQSCTLLLSCSGIQALQDGVVCCSVVDSLALDSGRVHVHFWY